MKLEVGTSSWLSHVSINEVTKPLQRWLARCPPYIPRCRKLVAEERPVLIAHVMRTDVAKQSNALARTCRPLAIIQNVIALKCWPCHLLSLSPRYLQKQTNRVTPPLLRRLPQAFVYRSILCRLVELPVLDPFGPSNQCPLPYVRKVHLRSVRPLE